MRFKKISSLKIIHGLFYMCSWSGFKNHRSFYYASAKGEYLHSLCWGQWETNFIESALIIMFINKCYAKLVQTGTYCDVSQHSTCSKWPCHSPRLPISGPRDAPSANKCKKSYPERKMRKIRQLLRVAL